MKPICEIDGVSKSYQGHTVLDKMSLTISAGEMVAITGKSGSGKTTVLNILGLLETADRGTVRLFGQNSPRPRSRKANQLLRFRLGYLFQNYALIENETVDYNLTVAQMYAKATSGDKRRLKAEALTRVGLQGVSRKKIYELSGGGAAAGRHRTPPAQALRPRSGRRANRLARRREPRRSATNAVRAQRIRQDDRAGHPRPARRTVVRPGLRAG